MTIDLNNYIGWDATNRYGHSGIIEQNPDTESEYKYVHKFSNGSYNTLTSDGKFREKGYSSFDIVKIEKSNVLAPINCNGYEMPSIEECGSCCDCGEDDEDSLGYAFVHEDDAEIYFSFSPPVGSTIIASDITYDQFEDLVISIDTYFAHLEKL